MNNEQYTVPVIIPDGQRAEGVFSLNAEGQNVRLSLEFLGRKLTATASDYFEAMVGIRRELERDDIFLNCYGSSKNVYPSGMGRDMGKGLKAYRMTLGKRARMVDLVFIFDTGEDVETVTISEQKSFFESWLNEITGDR